jgi:6-phosphofructokinase
MFIKLKTLTVASRLLHKIVLELLQEHQGLFVTSFLGKACSALAAFCCLAESVELRKCNLKVHAKAHSSTHAFSSASKRTNRCGIQAGLPT